MQVRATQLGFFGGKRRREGEVFDVPETIEVVVDGVAETKPFKLGRWMEPVGDEPAAPAAAEPPHAGPDGRPVTVSLKGRVGKPAKIKVDPSGEPKADA